MIVTRARHGNEIGNTSKVMPSCNGRPRLTSGRFSDQSLPDIQRTSDNVAWVKSKWSHADLNGKTVEFDFSLSGNRWVKGSGTFLVEQNYRGELSIAIKGITVSAPGKYFYV